MSSPASRSRALRWILLGGIFASAVSAEGISRLQFLGEARLQPLQLVDGAPVGGLSGITYDERRQQYYAISDDQGVLSPPRLFTLKIDMRGGRLGPEGVSLRRVTVLRTGDGRPLARFQADSEGIVFTDSDSLVVSSEGNVERGVDPFVHEYTLEGHLIRKFRLPRWVLPDSAGRRGVRQNLGFESLTLTPGGRFLVTAVENAVVQDGPEADLEQGSPARILKLDYARGRVLAEYLYWVEPIPAASPYAEGFKNNGLVELLALDEEELLALERSFVAGVGNSIRLYRISLATATDIRGRYRLAEAQPGAIEAVEKELLLDLAELGIRLDNLEGMTFGPPLPDGRRTLVMVSDDNFNRRGQVTQVLAFALGDEPITIRHIQGRGHLSPLAEEWLWGVEGVVTAVDPRDGGRGFWLQTSSPDTDPGTSEGLLVAAGSGSVEVSPGDTVAVDGRVEERASGKGLPVTRLAAGGWRVLSRGGLLPAAVRLGIGGRVPPSEVIDDDGLTLFEPEVDGLDFYESLEGMRVEVGEPLIVGPTSTSGEFVVVADAGEAASLRTAAGGLILRPGDGNPERLVVDTRLVGGAPALGSGRRLAGSLVGVLDYESGAYRLLPTSDLPTVEDGARERESTFLRGGGSRLTLATYNMANLDPGDGEERFARLAASIVHNLDSPDILALQEVQDNSGPLDDGMVAADETFGRLLAAIAARGGPDYEFCQIDPVDGRDGGEPGGNIRVGFLFNPVRVALIERKSDDPLQATRVESTLEGPRLSNSPGRIAPEDPAFAGDEELGLAAGRKSLAVEFLFRGHRLLVVNNHWKSKREDDPLMGGRQPPLTITESQRSRQAWVIRSFVDEWRAVDPEAKVVVLGDFNELIDRTPLRVLTATGLVDLIAEVPWTDRYTFIYRGNSQALDHILLSPPLMEMASPRLDVVHLNVDFAHGDRASDHDPVLVELELGEAGGR